MLYELRTYRVTPGRMKDLTNRFETASKIFERIGIRAIGHWTTVIGESNQNYFYILAWESLAERESKWAAFIGDKEWLALRAESEKNGLLVQSNSNQILAPTAFSKLA